MIEYDDENNMSPDGEHYQVSIEDYVHHMETCMGTIGGHRGR